MSLEEKSDSGFTRQSLKQRGDKEVVLALSQGSEVVLVTPRTDKRCGQGTESRPDRVWGSQDGLFSSQEKLSSFHGLLKPAVLGFWVGEVVGPQHLLSAHGVPDAFSHISECSLYAAVAHSRAVWIKCHLLQEAFPEGWCVGVVLLLLLSPVLFSLLYGPPSGQWSVCRFHPTPLDCKQLPEDKDYSQVRGCIHHL